MGVHLPTYYLLGAFQLTYQVLITPLFAHIGAPYVSSHRPNQEPRKLVEVGTWQVNKRQSLVSPGDISGFPPGSSRHPSFCPLPSICWPSKKSLAPAPPSIVGRSSSPPIKSRIKNQVFLANGNSRKWGILSRALQGPLAISSEQQTAFWAARGAHTHTGFPLHGCMGPLGGGFSVERCQRFDT